MMIASARYIFRDFEHLEHVGTIEGKIISSVREHETNFYPKSFKCPTKIIPF